MAKTLNLKLAGLWPSPNDYTAKEGALDIAQNIVIDQTDLGESRRGFETYLDNALKSLTGYLSRSFIAVDPSATPAVLLDYRYSSGAVAGKLLLDDNDTISGDKSFLPPSPATVCRMINWGKYVYVSAATGVKRYSTANNSSVPAGIPQALDLQLALTGSTGFMSTNPVASITATITNASPTLNIISNADIAHAFIGQLLSGTGITAGTTIQSITLSASAVIQTAATTGGSASFTVGSATGVVVGQLVSGAGFQTDSRVTTIVGLTITVTRALIQTATGVAATFSSDNTITMSANATSGAPTQETVSLSDGSQVAYRLVYGFIDENNATSLGAPSGFQSITNNTGHSSDTTVRSTIPSGITTSYFYQFYRSATTPSLSVVPADQMQKVAEALITSTDISNGYVNITDQTPDSLKGESLYTGTDVHGILQANYPPPVATDMASFRGYTLYSNFTLENQQKLGIDGVGSPNGVQVNDVITFTTGITTFGLTAKSSENAAAGQFKIFTTGTPAQNIADTATSFIKVMNSYASNDFLYAYLLSGPNELPGQMLIQARPTKGQFTIIASAHGTAWTPNIDATITSTAQNTPNGFLVSKAQQPEAVPRVNLFYAGGVENVIYRMIPLRDYVVFWTLNGVYRLTGTTITDFVCSPFDNTVLLVAPETAVALGNEAWGLTQQGFVSVSDGGVRLRSALQLNASVLSIVRAAPNSVRTVAFAVGYESDQRYIAALPINEGDTTATVQFCYNYVMDRWTSWTRDATAGYVNKISGLFLANGANTNIVKERKNGNYTDYADESFDCEIVSFSGFSVVLTSVDGITVGDLLWQDQLGGIIFSEIDAIDLGTNTVTVANELTWVPGLSDATKIYTAIACKIQWKPNPAGDPTEAKQFSEGQFAFRQPKFSSATLRFATDLSPGFEDVELIGLSGGGSGWGRFPFGARPWGGTTRPKTLRFYIPANKQYGGILIPQLNIRAGYSNWQLEGASISFFDVDSELGGPAIE